MTPERWRQIKGILDDATERPVAQRQQWLRQVCGDDVELLGEIESLLSYEDGLDGFIEDAPLSQLVETTQTESSRDIESQQIGKTIGSYRLVELLARGGMGDVYVAERHSDFEQRVAIKLLRPDLISPTAIRRFHFERQVLARLEHPNIARLLDGGTTDDGMPYLVMELIDGVAIDRYCDEHLLTTRQRLELFIELCGALSAAHQNLVIHRDLKPGNILVDRSGVPKLLDFGIAKSLPKPTDVGAALRLTQDSALTPRYASPEQLKGEPIGTASDVYSLSVVLYKVLTGHLPCQVEGRNQVDAMLAVCEEDPLPPSTVFRRELEIPLDDGSVLRRNPQEISLARGGDSKLLHRHLVGDIDCILLKALRKEPQSRYASVEQLAADLQRHLDGLPVSAHQGDLAYRAGKFIRRRRWSLLALTTIALLVLGFTAALQQQLRRTEAARDRAESVASFMVDLFQAAAPDRPAGEESTVRDLLDIGRQQLSASSELQDEVRSTLILRMGEVYSKLGDYTEAKGLLAEAVTELRKLYPNDHPLLATALNDLAVVYYHLGELGQAKILGQDCIAMRRRLGQNEDLIKPMNNLANVLMEQGDVRGAEAIYRESLALRRASLGDRHPNVAVSLRSLAMALYAAGDLDAAEPLLQESLDIRTEIYGRENPKVAMVLHSLGRIQQARAVQFAEQGNPATSRDAFDAAEDLMSEALETRRLRLGREHLHTALSQKDLASLLIDRGDDTTARLLLTQALTTLYAVRPENDWNVAEAEALLAVTMARRGQQSTALECVLNALQILERERGPDALETRAVRRRLEQVRSSDLGEQRLTD